MPTWDEVDAHVKTCLAADLADKYALRIEEALEEALTAVGASDAELMEFEKHGKHMVTDGQERDFYWKDKLILRVSPIELVADGKISFNIDKRWKEFAD